MHLQYLIQYIKKHYNRDTILELCHETFYDSSKRSVFRELEQIKKEQVYTKGKIWYGATYEYFMGNDIVIKSNNKYMSSEELDIELDRIEKEKRKTLKLY